MSGSFVKKPITYGTALTYIGVCTVIGLINAAVSVRKWKKVLEGITTAEETDVIETDYSEVKE